MTIKVGRRKTDCIWGFRKLDRSILQSFREFWDFAQQKYIVRHMLHDQQEKPSRRLKLLQLGIAYLFWFVDSGRTAGCNSG